MLLLGTTITNKPISPSSKWIMQVYFQFLHFGKNWWYKELLSCIRFTLTILSQRLRNFETLNVLGLFFALTCYWLIFYLFCLNFGCGPKVKVVTNAILCTLDFEGGGAQGNLLNVSFKLFFAQFFLKYNSHVFISSLKSTKECHAYWAW